MLTKTYTRSAGESLEAATRPGPSLLQIIALAVILVCLCGVAAQATLGYLKVVETSGDNGVYLRVAQAIQEGRTQTVTNVIQFWGLPYAIAAVSALTGSSLTLSLVLISTGSLAAVLVLVYLLYGPWVAAFFLVVDYELIQRSVFGASEPLFLLLLFAAIYVARKNHWPAAAFLGSLGTLVRPLGFLLVLSQLGVTAARKRWKELSIAIALGLATAFAYGFGLYHATGDPIANVHGYRTAAWSSSSPIAFPFYAIVLNALSGKNMGNILMTAIKILFLLAHVAGIGWLCWDRSRVRRAKLTGDEVMFLFSYSAFLVTYNSPTWALSIYPRLLLPVLPFLIRAYEDLLPRRWPALIAMGLLSVAIGTSSAIGMERFGYLLRQLSH